MQPIGVSMKILARFLVVLILVLGIAGCNVVNLSGNEQLPEISSLPLPKLPNWIEQISPIGEAEPLNQIRIRFKEALIPVESLDSPTQQQLLQKFEVIPLIPGRFRFLTPRMVGFQADKALPKATRFKVTLKAGLADLKNHRLEQDLAWTFNTEPIKLTNLPRSKSEDSEIQAFDIKPTLKFTSNVELDLNSTQEHLQLFPEGKNKSIKFKINLEKEETPEKNAEEPEEKFDPFDRNWIYKIILNETLEKAKTYRLEVASGLRPAKGNLATNTASVSKIETYSPLSFDKIEYYGQPDANGTYGRFIKGSPQLKFNNGLIADSAIENITITPKPKQAIKLIQAYDNEKLVSLNPWALEPATNYTITIGANLKDQFGQTLGKPVSFKYNTGDVAGNIQVPDGLHIFPSDNNLQLDITTVNLPESNYKAAYKVVQPTDLVYIESAYPSGKETDLIPNVNSWQSFRVSNHKNQPTDATVPIKEKLGAATGMLAYGVQAKTNNYYENGKQKSRESTTYGMVQLTNLGVFSQLFPESGFIRVHHLSDGSPVAAASVEIYQSQLQSKSRTKPTPCTIGKTDTNGTLLLSTDNLSKCVKANSEQAPELLVIAYEGKDWAFTRSQEYSGAYGYGIDSGWDSGKPISRGVIFSDRQLYQPGEKAAFTGFAYYLQKGELTQDKNAAYKITLLSPDGKKTALGTQTTNDFGTFSVELPIQKNQPLGYYTIQAKKANETDVSSASSPTEISGEFRIAEFKPPNFKVSLNLDKEFALPEDKITAKAESNYLFGSPVESGKAQYYVTRQQAYFTPKGWEQFSFGRQWLWPEENPVVPTDVLQLNQVLDGQGKNNQIVTVEKDLPYAMTYRVDVQVSDVSNLSVSDSKTFTALPSDRLIGLKSNFVADANKPFPIEVIVTDPKGNIIENQRVRVELQQMKYSSVTRLVEGGETGKDQVEYKTVGQTEVQSANTPVSVTLTPPESGSYRIRANFADTRDEVTATDLQVWVAGDNPVAWGEEDKRLEIKLDKETYKAGETATALIQSPYSEAELYFAIVRDKPLYETITKVKGGAPQIQFQVTPEMLPNAAVEAVLVRQGVPLNQVEPGSVENLVRIGFTPFKVNIEDKYLKIAVTPGQEKVQPATEQTLQLTLKDNQGNPAQGQFTVMVVNEAVLQLSGYHLPNLVETVYAEQPFSIRFSDNRPDVVTQPRQLRQKGWGYGGGFSAAAANTRIRKNFQPLAYYNGALLTDSNGQANINFKLPDDLTTWRVMVVATDGNFRFGNGETSFMTTKPLIANPILPQFARPGDRFLSGLSVTNNTGQTGNLAINGNVIGSLRADANQSMQTQAESGTRAYRFPVVADKTGEGKVQFVSKLNGIADAFEVPIDVKPLDVTEEVVETGKISPQNKRGEEVKIPLNIDKNVIADAGGLEISLASTLIPEITAPAKQVLEKEELPFLEPLASQLAIASNLQTISLKYNQSFANFNPLKQASQSLAELQKLQMPDGGFAAYPKQEKSDPFITPYAAESIATASSAGLKVDADMINRLRNYLKRILANPGQYDFCNTQLCKNQIRLSALMALNQFGEKQNDFLADIYQQRHEFDLVTQIKLARYLSLFPEWQAEYQNLMAQLQENIYQTGRTATVSLPQSWRWMSSPTTTQAQFLRLAIAQNTKPEILDGLLQSLLALRRNGTWQNSYNNAAALTALVEYSKLQPASPNFTATVQLAGKKLAENRFKGYNNPTIEVKIPTSELPKGRHDLILKQRGEGNLHYLVNYRYRLPGNQPGRFNGLRVDREIRAANQEKVLRKIGIYTKDESLTVAAGQVYDIGLEIIADHPVEKVVITDYLPTGFEAVDNSFNTSTPALQSQADSWQIGFRNIYRDRIVAYSDRFEPGVYSLHYLVRAVTPGTFLWPGADVHLQYTPEEFGRSAASTLVVKEP